jgi:hypothetical protein
MYQHYICKISPVFISSFASFHAILSLFLADSTSTTKRIRPINILPHFIISVETSSEAVYSTIFYPPIFLSSRHSSIKPLYSHLISYHLILPAADRHTKQIRKIKKQEFSEWLYTIVFLLVHRKPRILCGNKYTFIYLFIYLFIYQNPDPY